MVSFSVLDLGYFVIVKIPELNEPLSPQLINTSVFELDVILKIPSNSKPIIVMSVIEIYKQLNFPYFNSWSHRSLIRKSCELIKTV